MPRNNIHKKSHRKKRKKRTKQIKLKAGLGIKNLSNKEFFIEIGKSVIEESKKSNKSNVTLEKIKPIIKILSLFKPQFLNTLADKLRNESKKPDIPDILSDTKQGGGSQEAEERSQVMLFLIGISVYLYNQNYRNRTWMQIFNDIISIADAADGPDLIEDLTTTFAPVVVGARERARERAREIEPEPEPVPEVPEGDERGGSDMTDEEYAAILRNSL
jgi:hypothetical protein